MDWPGGLVLPSDGPRPSGAPHGLFVFGAGSMTTGDWLALVGLIVGCWVALARRMLQITKCLARLEDLAEDQRGIKKSVDRNTRDISSARERIGVLESLVK